jgi:TRAP-type mannitol/chloroaromatic compound transport system substrate-binding protein
MSHTASYYDWGKDPTNALGTTVPFGLNYRQMNAWLYHGGGIDMLNEFFNGTRNLHYLPAGNTGVQMGGWYRKEISSLADMQGLKMRIGGFGGKIIEKLGVVPQQLAGGDIYPALEKGTIDAAEWVGPYDDEKLGFFKVAKHYYYPGWWEPGPVIHFFVNKAEWAKLPKEYQEAFQAAAYEANVTMMAEYDHKNPPALSRLLQNGVKLQSYSNEILEAAYKAAQQLYSDESAKNPAFKKIYTEFDKYRKTQNAWFSIAEMRMDAFNQTHK